MAFCRSSLLILIYAILSSAVSFTLPNDVSKFIPSCAEECFESFLEQNFPISSCSTTPTLNCLCSHNTTSGYTVGEGALQCIVSEDNIGFCKGADATALVSSDAFSMCKDQENAMPNTHSTITATVILQTSMPSIVLIAPSSMETSNSDSNSSVASITSRSTASTVTATGSPSNILEPSGTSSAEASSNAAKSSSLTVPQITGITVASVGGVALIIGSVILFVCRRRKHQSTRDSDMLPFQADPSTNMRNNNSFRGLREVKGKPLGPGDTINNGRGKIAPPVPRRLDTHDPNMFSRRSIKPDAIGLAISPDTNTPQERRHSSKLLPEKPILTLTVPQEGGNQPRALMFSHRVSNPSALSRQSTTTLFEDGDDIADTAPAARNVWAGKSAGHALDNPSVVTIKPASTNPPHPAFFITGGAGNHWRPGQPSNTNVATPEYYVKPLNLSRSADSFSQRRRPDMFPRQQQHLEAPVQSGRPLTTTSSVYSARSSLPLSEHSRSSKFLNAQRSHRSYKQSGPYDPRKSADSLASCETADCTISPLEPRTLLTGDLSPVMESPSSGKSPVKYPKIPRRLSANTISLIPPPPQPNFKPWRQAELAAQRLRTNLVVPNAILGPGQAQYHRRQRSTEYMSAVERVNPASHHATSTYNEYTNRPRLLSPFQPTPSPSHSSFANSDTSTSPSLLAKRRGEAKAAALVLRTEEDTRTQAGKWRVLKQDEIAAAKAPGWRPMLATGTGRGGDVELERTNLPNTPGWVPRLTPERRGDHLFLNVQ